MGNDQRCDECKWWARRKDTQYGYCDFPVLTPESSPHPVYKAPMHETEGDSCRCFERKESGDADSQQG